MGGMAKALVDSSWYFVYHNLDRKIQIQFAGGTVIVREIDGGYSTEYKGGLTAHLNVNSVVRYLHKLHSEA